MKFWAFFEHLIYDLYIFGIFVWIMFDFFSNKDAERLVPAIVYLELNF